MRLAAVSFLVLAAPVLPAPNPFRLPFFGGGGGNQVNHPLFQPFQHHYNPPAAPSPGNPSPEVPAASPAAKEPWITMPFAPALNAPFYVPTIFAPHPTSSLPPTLSPAVPLPVTVTVPVPVYITSATPNTTALFKLERRGVTLGVGNAPATPLPTPPPADLRA